jgi:hypothetical protein
MGSSSISPSETCVPNNLKMYGPGIVSKNKQAGLGSTGVTWRGRVRGSTNRVCPVNQLFTTTCVPMKNCGGL